MTSDTYATKLVAVFAGGHPDTEKGVKVATSETIYPGYPIYVANGLAYAAQSSDRVTGVAASKPGHDDDVAFTALEVIEYYPVGQDTYVWVRWLAQTPQVTINEGDVIVLSGTDGYVMKWAYTDGTEASDTFVNKVGRSASYKVGSATNNYLIRVHLSG